ncbi:unnamed protein product [Heterobilharzia americana]|nr:unnamed protein product [Heterobilharzia americana]
MITFSSDTVIGHNNERTSSSESPYPTNNNDNTSAQQLDTEKIENGVNNRPSKTDINITVDSLEALSTQIRQQMSGAENWDVNDLGDPIELEEEYSSNTIDQSNPGLLESTKSDGSLYTPWQELIESAGRKASPVSNKFDVEDYVQCVGTSIAGIGHRDIIPVRKRTNGLDVLRRTGVSRKYFESNLLKHLTANSSSEELTENNTCDVAKFPDIWANGSEYSCCGILNQLSKLVLPLSRKNRWLSTSGLIENC